MPLGQELAQQADPRALLINDFRSHARACHQAGHRGQDMLFRVVHLYILYYDYHITIIIIVLSLYHVMMQYFMELDADILGP